MGGKGKGERERETSVCCCIYLCIYWLIFKNPHLRTCPLILERGEWRERNISVREKHRPIASHLCPDWRLNLQPFGPQVDTLTNWATPARAVGWFLYVPWPWGRTCNVNVLGYCSNQLSYPAWAMHVHFKYLKISHIRFISVKLIFFLIVHLVIKYG